MAQAKVAAPKKAAQQVIYRLSATTTPFLEAEQKRLRVTPRTWMVNSGTILWPYKTVSGKRVPVSVDTDPATLESLASLQWLPRRVRFLFGMPTPFVDEQEAEQGELLKRDGGLNNILDNPANRDALLFQRKELRVPAEDTVRNLYLYIAGHCENQHPLARRYGNTEAIYRVLDFGQIDQKKVELGKLKKECYEAATTARESEMIPHAKFLGIPFFILDTGEEREMDAIREDYKDAALNNPELFKKTFNDPKIKLIHQIRVLSESGVISINTITPGMAKWSDTGKDIAILPPDKDPVTFLAEFALTTSGAEFSGELKANF